MSNITVGSPEYKAMLRRYNELFALTYKTPEQVVEMLDIARLLDAIELAHGETRDQA